MSSPRAILQIVTNRLKKSRQVARVGDAKVVREVGGIDGYGSGWQALIEDDFGDTFLVKVTLYS